MNRKDLIIIAVLVNSALLVVLFISALKTDPSHSQIAREEALKKSQEIKLAKIEEINKKQQGLNKTDKLLSTHVNTKEERKQIKEPVANLSNAKELPQIKESKAQLHAKESEKREEISEKVKVIEKKDSSLKTVTVKKGDFLEKIAKANSVSVDALMKANNLSNSRLKIGQLLYIPESTPKVETRKSASDTHDSGVYYTVRNGDNLWKIAIENHVKVEDLLRLNKLNEKKAKSLRPGDKLRLK